MDKDLDNLEAMGIEYVNIKKKLVDEITRAQIEKCHHKISNCLREEFYTLEKSCFVMNGF